MESPNSKIRDSALAMAVRSGLNLNLIVSDGLELGESILSEESNPSQITLLFSMLSLSETDYLVNGKRVVLLYEFK
jgi:hypothetical protein